MEGVPNPVTGARARTALADATPGFPALARLGRILFALALVGIGVENMVCARLTEYLAPGPPPRLPVIPVLPWLPPQAALGWFFGGIVAVCGLILLARPAASRWARGAAVVAGIVIAAAALGFDLPRYAGMAGDMGMRTLLFDALALALFAWLQAAASGTRLDRLLRVLLALCLVVFGSSHFLALAAGGNQAIFTSVMPQWLPWPLFWIGLFGVAFIAAAVSLGANILLRWGAAGLGAMFGLWFFTLHLPRTLGWYAVAGRDTPDEWSSLLIALACWGGAWVLAGTACLCRGLRPRRLPLVGAPGRSGMGEV